MTTTPANPLIYHITHVDNLADIVARGGLLSDAARTTLNAAKKNIGMNKIKARRLALPVRPHAGLHVGDCVPFYFCPRSIMLYLIHRANDPDLEYRGGQGPIVHLEADLHQTVAWAAQNNRRWAFSLSNAGAYYTQFRSVIHDLGDIDWEAVASRNFGNSSTTSRGPVKEGKQAEFLLESTFPWDLVTRIGVGSGAVRTQVLAAISGASHKPLVTVQPDWYF